MTCKTTLIHGSLDPATLGFASITSFSSTSSFLDFFLFVYSLTSPFLGFIFFDDSSSPTCLDFYYFDGFFFKLIPGVSSFLLLFLCLGFFSTISLNELSCKELELDVGDGYLLFQVFERYILTLLVLVCLPSFEVSLDFIDTTDLDLFRGCYVFCDWSCGTLMGLDPDTL